MRMVSMLKAKYMWTLQLIVSYTIKCIMKIICIIIIMLMPILSGCDNEPSIKVDLSKRIIIEPQKIKPTLTYAYLPQYSHETSFERHTLLVDYLQKTLSQPIQQIFPDTFMSFFQMVQHGEVDIAFVNPVMYVALEQEDPANISLLAKIEELSNKSLFSSEIIVRHDNKNIQTIADCAGKRWIAVDPLSAGGFVFALGLFYEHGLSMQDFAVVDFAHGPGGKQEKAIMGVYTGQYDFATVRDGSVSLMNTTLDISTLRVVARTKEFPSWIFIARKGLDSELKKRVQDALLALSVQDTDEQSNVQARRILEQAHIHAIVPTSKGEYDPIRAIMQNINYIHNKDIEYFKSEVVVEYNEQFKCTMTKDYELTTPKPQDVE